MQPSVRLRKFGTSRVVPRGDEAGRVRKPEAAYPGVWRRGVVPTLMIGAFLLMSAAVVVGFEESKPLSKCFAISRAGPLCH